MFSKYQYTEEVGQPTTFLRHPPSSREDGLLAIASIPMTNPDFIRWYLEKGYDQPRVAFLETVQKGDFSRGDLIKFLRQGKISHGK